MAYESYCWHCRVTHPPGTRRCIHCGGPVLDQRPDSSTRLTTSQGPAPPEIATAEPENAEAEARPQQPRGLRIGVTALWIVLAIAASIYRACTQG